MPLELPPESFSDKAGFGEILALKDLLGRDKTSSHVIRYEDAWLEEPCALPDAVQDVLPPSWRPSKGPSDYFQYLRDLRTSAPLQTLNICAKITIFSPHFRQTLVKIS